MGKVSNMNPSNRYLLRTFVVAICAALGIASLRAQSIPAIDNCKAATEYSHPPADTVAAMGKGKNRCYVIPSREMVVIRMGDSQGREFSDNAFLAKLLETQ
jgi:hypothetical protein